MNIGLSYMTQIRGGDDTGQLVGGDTKPDGSPVPIDLSEDQTPKSLGGWIALTFNQLVAAVSAGYHKEHNTDDTHGAIHCTSLSERNRTTPLGEWISAPIQADTFTGSGAMTVSVSAMRTYAYTLMGKTLTVAWMLDTVTVGGTPDIFIKIKIPGGYTSAKVMLANTYASDNGTARIVPTTVQQPSASAEPYIFVAIAGFATNWSASAGNTKLFGQISFEVAQS